MTGMKVHVGALEVFKIKISYKLLQRGTKALQEPGWVPANAEMGTRAPVVPAAPGSCSVGGTELCTSIVTRLLTWEQDMEGSFARLACAFLLIKKFSLVLQVSFAAGWPPIRLAASCGSLWLCHSGLFTSKYLMPNLFAPVADSELAAARGGGRSPGIHKALAGGSCVCCKSPPGDFWGAPGLPQVTLIPGPVSAQMKLEAGGLVPECRRGQGSAGRRPVRPPPSLCLEVQ